MQWNFAIAVCFAEQKKECHLLRFKTACAAAVTWAVLGTSVWAQSAAETVLQSLVKDFAATGVTITQGSKSVADGSAEWRNVVLAMPRVKGQLKLDFIRAVEQADGSFVVEYPKQMTGVLRPVAGLGPLNVMATGDVSHTVSSAARGAVHVISTDQVLGVLNGANPSSTTTMTLTDFTLEHTADRGVPLRIDRIRDWLFSGVLDVDMKGGFAVLDKLVALGDMSASQAGVARTMVGGFTTQGPDGEDHLRMRVDVRKNGAILINGNPF